MNKKKHYERYILNSFISNPELELKIISITDSETPDFIIETMDKKISIELTGLINPDLRQTEAYRNEIIKQTEKIFKEKYNEDLYVLITFENINLNMNKKEQEKYSKSLFDIIENLYLENKDSEFDITVDNDEVLNSFIKTLHINNKLGFNNWQHFSAYKVEWISLEWLTDRIEEKETNLKKYKDHFDENWLLLSSNFGTKSSANSFDYINIAEIKSIFDKIFVYKYIPNETITIK